MAGIGAGTPIVGAFTGSGATALATAAVFGADLIRLNH